MQKEWIISPEWPRWQSAAAEWSLPPLVVQLLHNRGVETADEARAFVSPRMDGLLPPETLPGVSRAADVVCQAIERRCKIVLYGDYDVDGITGVALLWHLLKLAGAEVSYYVPHRIEEGYGLNSEALAVISEQGAELVVTVDCGITSVDEAKVAREKGITLVITDHHQPKAELPQVAAIVHPTVEDGYPNGDLCGAGVAFKLAWMVAQRLSGSDRVLPQYREFLINALPLVALGTIADVVPLTSENRVIAHRGLALLPQTPLPGLRALLQVAGLSDSAVDGTDVGFKIAPRLNAAGRMGHARLAIDLLTWADENRAREIAIYLDEHNNTRQATQRKYVKQACEMIDQAGLADDTRRAIVLAAEGWHAGIIGIVAARVVERYHRPAVLIALEGAMGQGSARSIPCFALNEALENCAEFLVSHGGHAMAAGLRIERELVPEFSEAFVRYAGNVLSGTALLPRLKIDAVVDLPILDERTVRAIQALGPFGQANPKPVLATEWLELVEEPRCVGSSGQHLQLSLRDGGAVMRGIAFGAADKNEALREHRRCRVAFEPVINEFRGVRRVEMQVIDFKFPGGE